LAGRSLTAPAGVDKRRPCKSALGRERVELRRQVFCAAVQGGELDVLDGAPKLLKKAEFVFLETSLFETYRGAPLLHDVVAFMNQSGFVLYDIADLLHRPLDNALIQADLAFVPASSPLRQNHAYATPEQRARQNGEFDAGLRRDKIRKGG